MADASDTYVRRADHRLHKVTGMDFEILDNAVERRPVVVVDRP